MASSMPGCTSAKRRTATLLLLGLLLGLSTLARADSFTIREASTRLQERVFLMDARIDYRLSSDAITALNSGVPLTIVLDMEIERKRKWWLNETIAELQQDYLIIYHALSHRYLVVNLNSGANYTYTTLSTALDELGRIYDLPLLDATFVEQGEHYEVTLQASLEIESLPAPLRPLAYLTSAWRLKSNEYTWSLLP